ncbi:MULTISPECIES: cobaltochelatase subunit CobN [Cyanobium]|uniref:Cobaltochelatase subunit CobN n=2 Tax=Cyanobium TaxID=167375 RepID=A0A2P7N0I3_9CYAN|nr:MULTISPECIES: cobaltochelatase subunit CobN [Cyanobium]MCP9779709.1 cobaltochelatase subunit CobN [Cyanobium sp. To12R1]PSJ06983.1 cobaltochelatase subunit CobN [Cyanobium usitatum str. Tous]
MHRLASVPGGGAEADIGALVEQPAAPVLLLSSADTDLLAIDQLLEREPQLLTAELRGLNLAALAHPAQIDHYLNSTVRHARLVVVRLLGGRGHWSYGLEQLQRWAGSAPERQLLMLAGTADEEQVLAGLGTVAPELAIGLARCLREGGPANLRQVLQALQALLEGLSPAPPRAEPLADPLPHDWQQEQGPRVGVIAYRALLQAGDLALMDATLQALRQAGLCPRALWVSGLRDGVVQRGVADLLQREGVQAVLCSTSFASVQFEEAGLGAPLWEQLGVPVLQLLCSSQPRSRWQTSSIGLGPTDLTLQVALPELDGRLTTRIGAFKETVGASERLASALQRYEPDPERLTWIAQLCANWIRLRQTPSAERRVALVLANYPTRNSRLANGVGLDTPASTALMLQWLAGAGYKLHGPVPVDGEALIHMLLAGRSNDPESEHRPALTLLPLATYQDWYACLPSEGRQRLEAVWGPPELDVALVSAAGAVPGFPIRGLQLGHVSVLIQPDRGYDRDPALSYHSPDLPPTHAYLAQYLWLRLEFGAHAVVHVGKHGNLEWLPGKGLGLSASCFPEWALGPLPHLYPFIVNDPGEGSQAKRRSQAVILDHLTPPLGRAGLHGALQRLEVLLDEYWEACQLGSERAGPLRQALAEQLENLELPLGSAAELDSRLDAADGYLCELKEAQIRLGLHTFGTLPEPGRLAELLLCLARCPLAGQPGLTQALAQDLQLSFDPWGDEDATRLCQADQQRLQGAFGGELPRLVGDGVALLEAQALTLVEQELAGVQQSQAQPSPSPGPRLQQALMHLRQALMPPLLACGRAEREAFLRGLEGERIAAGPSGAPTRGRPDLLPTGRNFYSVDLRGLPTEAAWDLGRRSAELLLELHLQEQGEHLSSLALSVWGTATMRNGGEDIAQALALLGVRPVWDGPTRRMVDLEVIPLSLLGRARVDVTLRISGLFRDAFPQLVGWVNRATELVSALNEPEADNPLAAAYRREGTSARVYGSAPGAYGAGLQGLIDSGHWEERADLGEAFLNWSSWRYDSQAGASGQAGIEAQADRSGLEQRLKAVQVVLHNQDNREHDLLDSDDYYQFQGGLSAAVERVSGQRPALWFGDHSRAARPRLHRLEREFDKVLRSRVLNPRWIAAMKGHGYKGGFEMAASLDYLFAYDASTGRVPDWGYGAICDQWLGDQTVRDFLVQSNPWALRDMAERLLEAHNRGLWEGAQKNQLEQLRQLVLDSESLIEQR